MSTPIIEMRGIQKHFGAVHALRNVNFRLAPGEILGLVGDNSAGKSTLMKVMTGAYQRDGGDVLVDGKPTRFGSPQESRDAGIEMIYQDFALCGNMDIGQNIFLGRWPRRFGVFVDRPRMYEEAVELVQGFGIDACPNILPDRAVCRHASAAGASVLEFEPDGKAVAEITAVHMWAIAHVNMSTVAVEGV